MRLQLRYFLRLIAAFLKKFKGLLSFSILIGIIFFFLLRTLLPFIFRQTSHRVGVVGQYTTQQLPKTVGQNISLGLTISNIQGEVEPGIALSWESPDQGKTWVFHLNQDLTWQDGSRVQSSDINYDFKDVTVERPDQETIIYQLKDKFSPFPLVVSEPLFKRGLMGVGEWRVEKISFNHGNIEKLTVKNKQQVIVYKFYPTEERAKLALKLGEVQKISDIYNPSPFESWKTVEINKEINYHQTIILFFNNKSDKLADKTVRQALNYAIDKNGSNLERSLSPISPLSWAYNPQVKSYNLDINKAKETFKNVETEYQLKLYSTPVLISMADKIAKDWQAVGVQTSVMASPGIPAEFDAFLAILDIPNDPDQYSLWHSTQTSTNISGYQSQRIDKLLEDGRSELNLEARIKTYLDFQRYLIEDCPAVLLYHPTVYTIERK